MNRPTPFNVLRPGELSASEFQRLQQTVESAANPVGLGIQASSAGVGFLSQEIEWAYAKITERNDSTSPSRYTWRLILPKQDGDWYDDYDGAQFEYNQYPAYEANKKKIDPPYYCIIYKGQGQWVVFFAAGSGSNVQPLRVTSLTPDSDGLLPGKVLFYDVITNRFTDGPDIKVRDLNAAP